MGRKIGNVARDDKKGLGGFGRAPPGIISLGRKRPPPFENTVVEAPLNVADPTVCYISQMFTATCNERGPVE